MLGYRVRAAVYVAAEFPDGGEQEQKAQPASTVDAVNICVDPGT